MFFIQLCAFKIENRSLAEKLKNVKSDVPLDSCHNGLNNSNEDQASNNDSSNGSCTKPADEEGKDSLNPNFQVPSRFLTCLCDPNLDLL